MTRKQERDFKAELEEHLDFLWRFIIKARANFGCEIKDKDELKCGGFRVEAMHLITRAVPHLKYDLRNGRTGCQIHHRYYHDHPEKWWEVCKHEWMVDWAFLRADKWHSIKHSDDLVEIYEFLRTEAAQQLPQFINDYRARFEKIEAFENTELYRMYVARQNDTINNLGWSGAEAPLPEALG